jgi:hypothetical protein
MGILTEAANWIMAHTDEQDRYPIAARLRRLEEVAGELDDGLSELIDGECEAILMLGYHETDSFGAPSHHAAEVGRSHAHEINTAVTDAIAGAVEFGRLVNKQGDCSAFAQKTKPVDPTLTQDSVCGECGLRDKSDGRCSMLMKRHSECIVIAAEHVACVKFEAQP